jgi:DNA-binding Lrp family transcriptional regulator
LSASQCSRRRSALKAEGIIEGYHAAINNQAVGLDVMVFIHVGLATQSADSSKAFRALIGRMDEVQEAFSLTGETDYLVTVISAGQAMRARPDLRQEKRPKSIKKMGL